MELGSMFQYATKSEVEELSADDLLLDCSIEGTLEIVTTPLQVDIYQAHTDAHIHTHIHTYTRTPTPTHTHTHTHIYI